MSRKKISEATTGAGVATPVEGQTGRFKVQIATPGRGTSGYYSAEVLEAAAAAKIFPAGHKMYLNHEMADGSGVDERGDRSLKDLTGTLESDAVWDKASQSLIGIAKVFGPYRPVLAEAADSIGLSMQAWADVSMGTGPDGVYGVIVNELVEAQSVDFVSNAGRGGKILQVIESARADARAEFADVREAALVALRESRNIGQWVESRLHLSLTCQADDMYGNGYLTREERIALSGAFGAALDAFTESLEASAPQLYLRDLWDDPTVIAVQVEESLTSVPSHPAGQSTIPKEFPMGMIQVDEAENRRVTTEAGRVPVLESERDTAIRERDEARTERDTIRASEANRVRASRAGKIIETQSANKVEFSKLEIAGLTVNLPVTEAGVFDEAAFTATVDKEIASVLEAAGAGTVTGFGGGVAVTTTQPGATQVAESAIDRGRAAAFGPKKES